VIKRPPIPSLRPFVKLLWGADEKRNQGLVATRERLIPTGAMSLVFRVNDFPIRVYDSLVDASGHRFDWGVVGGVRTGFYVKELCPHTTSIGALLEPGAAQLLFGIPANELAERHTAIEDLWGQDAIFLWERMREAGDLGRQVELFEMFLAERLPLVRGIHPAIAYALERLQYQDIGEIVSRTGYSHRHFLALFRSAVGLPPRVYSRLLRFQRALGHLQRAPTPSWLDIALEAGYADQAHFNREFREFTGLSPTQYRAAATGDSHHVPVG